MQCLCKHTWMSHTCDGSSWRRRRGRQAYNHLPITVIIIVSTVCYFKRILFFSLSYSYRPTRLEAICDIKMCFSETLLRKFLCCRCRHDHHFQMFESFFLRQIKFFFFFLLPSFFARIFSQILQMAQISLNFSKFSFLSNYFRTYF